MYYWRMLNAINEYEKKDNNPSLNKGMVCGNFGVSSLAEGDIDGGIAYLLWASHEDRWWSRDPNRNIFRSPLYTQFARGTNRQGRSQFGEEAPWVMMEKAIDKYNTSFKDTVKLEEVFKELEGSSEHRGLLEGTLWVIHRNRVLLKWEKERRIYLNKNNLYSRLRLFDGLIALCRFVELRMRHYEKIEGTLGELITYVFKNEKWFKKDVSQRTKSPQKPEDFDNLMKETLEKYNRPAKSMLILWTLRNYATHVSNPETPYFFEKIEDIFHEVFITYIYYLKYKKRI